MKKDALVPLNYRSIWISDVHLGTPACRAADLLGFLDGVSADRIYLVGDIIDLRRLKVRPRFPDVHRRVVSRFIQLADAGTEIVYVPGNYDFEFRDFEFRDFAGQALCGIKVLLEATHVTRTGQRLLVTHGDVLDREIRRGTNLEQFGAAAYAFIPRLDVALNQLRSRLGHDHVSSSRQLKRRLASANEYIRRFEEIAARYAAMRDFDGIVCGHIHRPAMRSIGGVWYANDGDWVEHRTALAESAGGSLELLRWQRDAVVVDRDIPSPCLAA